MVRYKFKVRLAWVLTEAVPLILGRLDVFNKFRIVFDEQQGFIDFQEQTP